MTHHFNGIVSHSFRIIWNQIISYKWGPYSNLSWKTKKLFCLVTFALRRNTVHGHLEAEGSSLSTCDTLRLMVSVCFRLITCSLMSFSRKLTHTKKSFEWRELPQLFALFHHFLRFTNSQPQSHHQKSLLTGIENG